MDVEMEVNDGNFNNYYCYYQFTAIMQDNLR